MSERKGKPIVRKRKTDLSDFVSFNEYTIDQAFEHFISLKKTIGVRDRTLKDYYILMNFFTEWLAEEYPSIEHVDQVDKTVIREYIVYLKEERFNERTQKVGLSPFTVNVRIRFLKAFFNALFKDEIINTNPTKNVQLMRVDQDNYEVLSDEEINKILSVPDDREYAQFRDLVIMYLMLDTGMRISEVCDLEVKDVDFKKRCIILPAIKNKNRKPRILPLSNDVLKLLMELVAENQVNFNTDYLIVSNIGTRYNPNSFRKRLSIYKEKTNIQKRISPHVFRHIFCRNFILNGGDIFTLQRIVGHEDITTTRKYIQLDDENLRNQHSQYSPIVKLRNNIK